MLNAARIVPAILFIVLLPSLLGAQTVFLHESFDDDQFGSRGWYDNSGVMITTEEHLPGGAASAIFHFPQGNRTPESGGAIRHKFPASEELYISYWVKYSANWDGSNRPYHPHEFNVVTNLDHDYIGPAHTHLTLYIEQNEGRPMLAIQDGLNIDQSRARQDLTQVTEDRAVAGCNGDSDGHGDGDCYQSAGVYRNGKRWLVDRIYFSDSAGPYYKNDWHHVEAYFRLNSIVEGKGIADGVLRYWFDGAPLIDHTNVAFRTGAHPTMRFNQFLIAPYIGDGSPVAQTMWIDELTLASSRPLSAVDAGEKGRSKAGSSIESLTAMLDRSGRTIALRFTLPERSVVTAELYDLLGRRLFSERHELDAGAHTLPIDAAQLAAGHYLCRIVTSDGAFSTSVIVER